MPRRRKDYRIAVPPERRLGTPGALEVRFLDEHGALAQRFDFAVHARRAVMAAEIAFAFRHHLADKSEATRTTVFASSVRAWFRFLDDHDRQACAIVRMADVGTATLHAFIAWLDLRPLAKGSRYSAWSGVKRLIAWLQRHRIDLVDPELEIPFNAFPRKNAAARPREAMSKDQLDAVLAACRIDLEASWATFRAGREALNRVDRATVAAEPDLRRLDLDDRGLLMAVLADRFGGLVPPQSVTLAKGAGLWPLHFAIQAHGGAREVAKLLHAVPETLVPHMVAIAAQTFANPEALRCLRRDCMSEHLLLDGRVVVTWTKGRSSRPQRRSFLRDRGLSVPNLIDRVLAMTEVLVPHAPAGERDRVFLCGGVMGPRRVGLIPPYLMTEHVRRFAARHGLRDAKGAPLALMLAGLRSTGLALAHATLGYDLLKTQVLANHASPDTTRRYIDRPAAREAYAAALGRLQARFVDTVRGDGIAAPPLDGEMVDVATVARDATASGFVCADPLAGIAPGQRPGRLCTAWLGCFTCPNAVIPLDAQTLARLLCTRAALMAARGGMAPDRWRLLYAPKLEILERDVLPRFPATLHAAAAALHADVPPTPPIE